MTRIVRSASRLCFGLAALSLATASAAPSGALPPPGVTAFQGTAATAGADGADGDYRGAAVALSGDVLLVGAPRDNLSRGDRAGSVLVYRRGAQGWALETKLLPPQPTLWGGFGSVVALDGATAVVGAGSEFSTITGAFVFAHDGTEWRLQATLAPVTPPELTVARFGGALAVSGARVLIGAPSTRVGATLNAGTAFVFTRQGDVWTQQAILRAPPDAPPGTTFFGGAVALAGNEAIVGTRADAVTLRGEAFAFLDSGSGNWGVAQRLVPNIALGSDAGFGSNVAIAGGLALVSAPGAGAHIVFRRVAGTWQPQSSISVPGQVAAIAPPYAYLGSPGSVLAFGIDLTGSAWTPYGPITPPPTAFGFGAALAADGQRVVVGAPQASLDGNLPWSGAASVHLASGSKVSLEQNLRQMTGPTDAFGHSVAIDGDTALIGAPGAGVEDANGVVRWLERRGGRWLEAGELTVPDGGRFRNFGSMVALRGNRALIGATGLDRTGTGYNRDAWLFRRDGAGWTLDATLTIPADPGQIRYGASAALSGDFAFVGAPETTPPGADPQGAVHVYRNTPGGWIRQQVLLPPGNRELPGFGTAIGVDDEVLLIGAPSISPLETGEVHVYRRSGAEWLFGETLAGESVGSRFGTAIFLDAHNAWVGAPRASGSVYRFPRQAGGFGAPQRFDAELPALGFGEAIAGGGDRVLVGAPFDEFGAESPTIGGAVYRLLRVGDTWVANGKIAAADYSPLAQYFGFAIAADAGAFIIGAPRSGSDSPFGNPFEGAAFVVDDQTLFGDSFEP